MRDRPAQHTPRPAPDRDRADLAIDAASWLGTLAIFAYGAALSYDVLHTIAQACGLGRVLAWLWPLGFETFMAVAAVSVLAEQRARPDRTPWYPWALTALAAGSSILLNFGHPYIPLDPPPRWLVAAVYGVPPVCAPFAWHLFLLRVAHHRRRHTTEDPQYARQDTTVLASTWPPAGQDVASPPEPAPPTGQDTTAPTAAGPRAGQDTRAPAPGPASTLQDAESTRTVVRVLLAHETQDAPVSWRDVTARTGLSRSRAYALLREERALLARANGHARAGMVEEARHIPSSLRLAQEYRG
jgi:hypothetical protein